MIVVRFKVTCQPDKAEVARLALEAVVAPSRALNGVVSFDIAQDLTDATSFVATEVFADRDALARQASRPSPGVHVRANKRQRVVVMKGCL